jgi:hypothetical protein
LDPLYLNVPDSDNKAVRNGDHGPNWSEAYKQPLDLVLCPTLQWGCRYLTVDHRTLVGHVWKQEAIADLRAGKGEPRGQIDALFGKKVGVRDLLAAIEGVVLRDRSLRFAKFDESRLYATDMINSDLSRTTFKLTQLQGANLLGADLSVANLSRANLSSANLSSANLSGTDLRGANLSRANLSGVTLAGADLRGANLSNTNLNGANLGATDESVYLFGADLRDTQNLTQAQLDEACGRDVKLPAGLTLKPCP